MRSHTGGAMTLGKGFINATSKRQKLNTRSSTEAELVAVDDMMHKVIWTRLFLQAQGYETGPSVIKQDNKSAILLENNGRRSCGARSRHLHVRYFFVSDRIKAGEVVVEYCPTTDMVSDVLTKPMQGSAFLRLRQMLLNLPDELSGLTSGVHRSVLKEANDDGSTTNKETQSDTGVKTLEDDADENKNKEYTMLVCGRKIRYTIQDSEWIQIANKTATRKSKAARGH